MKTPRLTALQAVSRVRRAEAAAVAEEGSQCSRISGIVPPQAHSNRQNAMKITTGMKLMKDLKPVEGDSVSFRTGDDREMFKVRIGKDGRSIEVRACDACRVGGVNYSTSLVIEPQVTNAITVRTKRHND